MSRKNTNIPSELSTKSVDNHVRLNPRMDENGGEVLSPVSRTAAVYLPTMGERIRRYTRSPEMQRDVYHDEAFWDDEDHEALFSEDGSPVSKHEERYIDGLEKAKKVKTERDEKEKADAIEKEKAAQADFRKRVREAIAEGTTIPTE